MTDLRITVDISFCESNRFDVVLVDSCSEETTEQTEAFGGRNKNGTYEKQHQKMVRYGFSDWLGQNRRKENPLSQTEIG